MEAVNELDYILKYLEAQGISMQMVAIRINRDYDYIKGQKTQKDPKKQSSRLLRNVKTAYAEELKDVPPYQKDYPSNGPSSGTPIGEIKYTKLSDLENEEEDRKEIEIENNQLLHFIKDKLQAIEGNQQKDLAYQRAVAKYVAKKDSNGDERREKEILEQFERDAASNNTASDAQESADPDPLKDE